MDGEAGDEDSLGKGKERAVNEKADDTCTQHAKWCDLC